MLNCSRIIRLTRTRSIRCYGCREEKGVQWFTNWSLPSKRRRGKSMWVMRGFESHFYLSLSLSEFWSADCRLSSFDLTQLLRNLSFISFFFSDRIRLGFLCFLTRRLRIGRKITLNSSYFLTNFIDISLCADPMRRNPFFNFEDSLSNDNIRWMLSWALVAIIILCVR